MIRQKAFWLLPFFIFLVFYAAKVTPQTTMKYEKYISLIKSLEIEAEKNPKLYYLKSVGLALLGYGYFGFLVAIPLFILLAIIGLVFVNGGGGLLLILNLLGKFVILIAGLALGAIASFFGAFKSLFKSVGKPEGYEITKQDFPVLFNEIEGMCKSIDSPRPRHVFVSSDFNAAAIHSPRWGVFGHVTYLNLGLPLMQALSPDQFRAVIAHELGHFSKKHRKGASWIYQLRETWGRFLDQQQSSEHGSMSFLYKDFVEWFFPYFNAYSFVLARQQEREADRMAVGIAGAKPLAEALINLNVKGQFVEEKFWGGLLEQAKKDPNPPQQVFSRMFTALREKGTESEDALNLEKILARRTDFSDTHPSLKERLDLMGYKLATDKELLRLPASVEDTALKFFLGSKTDEMVTVFDAEWQEKITEVWKAQHEHFGEAAKRMGELEAKATEADLTDNEMYELASLKYGNQETEEAKQILKQIISRNPKHADAVYSLGGLYLDEDNDEGIKLLEDSARLDLTLSVAVNERLSAYLHGKGRDEESIKYMTKAESSYDVLLEADRERQQLIDTDAVEAHEVDAETLEKIKTKVAYHDEIEAAYVARKALKYLPEKPVNILAIKIKTNWLGRAPISPEGLMEALANSTVEANITYVVNMGKLQNLGKRIKEIPGSQIYQA